MTTPRNNPGNYPDPMPPMGEPCPPPQVVAEKQPIKGARPFGALAFLPGIVKVAKDRGYALTVHGSLARDFDFVAVPWTEDACPPEDLAEAIRARCGGIVLDLTNPCQKPHGRLAWKFHLGGGPYVDLSVMPLKR